ncbi:hypothetical protein VC83_08879 [Pseudogymnoascus destructans]|uniref:HhH-GPD domain-containing protein n=2 Tax=Pseudogymnoascus destructans TaxID=655981 RepID=L8FSC5_PSED2|nr:uncharacterized protein VC83_08879 [Pseudogymnoascus destructans]ELR02586.1 hypothetical protein GMDG_05552 [Pseudogymnoascus destructans 20631-21]OAF54755.1 hypothetical protein VC83_08879 [Pseudogymnoascus destructans]
MAYKIEKRRRSSSSSEYVDPRRVAPPPKLIRHGYNTRKSRSQSPDLTDSPHPKSDYSPTTSNLAKIAQVSPIIKAETESPVLEAFPEFDISSSFPSQMSVDVDSINPFESPDPDSPMPQNATESESSIKLGSDVELTAFHPPEVLCIGHSTLPFFSLTELLKPMDVSHIVDIRSRPVSNVSPQFNFAKLHSSWHLMIADMQYVWLGESLGGRRENMEGVMRHREMLVPDLKNYAAYMTTPEFKAGLAQLKELVIEQAKKKRRVVIMCEEAVHWRCHRRMIADRLVADNYIVKHMGLKAKECVEHVMWNIARLALDGEVVYDVPRLVN